MSGRSGRPGEGGSGTEAGDPADPVEAKSEEEIRHWLATEIAGLLGIPLERVDPDLPFARFGFDSARLYIMLGDFSDWLGTELGPAIVLDYPTVNSLARRLAGGTERATPALPTKVVRFSRGGPHDEDEPIAVVGIGCRYPGDADDPHSFWRVVAGGKSCIGPVPRDRWDADGFYSPDPAAPGRAISKVGGFLRNIDEFDARFFGISPREAPVVDPQQRILLEIAWEAFEDAGQPPDDLAGSRTGVFVGYCYSDFVRRMSSGGGIEVNPYTITGLNDCIAANRVSYFFDLRGPSMVLHTASSSSLVAVHQACVSLWSGECDLALAGGITLALSPSVHIVYTKAGAMSPDVCRPFDAGTQGMSRGEGGGFVLLRPLSRALANRDRIYSIVLGSAVSQDGRTNGLSAPSQEGIERVMRLAWRRAGLQPSECQYVEAHGTGTVMGDLVEGNAIAQVVAPGRAEGAMCRVGSVKANFGHTEAGSGVAGLIKTSLALYYRALPPTLHCRTPNPDIPWERSQMEVQRSLSAWPSPDRLLVGGVTSLGLGGTNAHVVVSEAPSSSQASPSWMDPGDLGADLTVARALVVPLSARSTGSLRRLADRYASLLEEPGTVLGDVAWSAAVRRSHLTHRLAVVGSSARAAAARLRAYVRGEAVDGVTEGHATGLEQRRTVFVFSGQGSQWPGMGAELLVAGPEWRPFQEKLRACDRLLRAHVDWSLIEELARPKESSSLDQTYITQPAIFCIQVALAAQWASWGVMPDGVVGHSIGEVTAAHVAGAWPLEEAIRLVAIRSKLTHGSSGQGRMLAVEMSPAEAEELLAPLGDRVAIAAYNSGRSLTLAGDPASIDQVTRILEASKIHFRRLRLSTGFHSSLMDRHRPAFVKAIEHLRPRATTIPMISALTGLVVDGRALDAEYWGKQLREPVRFAAAIAEAADLGYGAFIEVSPHQVLSGQVADCFHDLGHDPPILVPTLLRGKSERETMLSSLGTLYARGLYAGWQRFFPEPGRFVDLPRYPWNRKRHWSELSRPWPELVPAEPGVADPELARFALEPDNETTGQSPLLARLAEIGLGEEQGDLLTKEGFAMAARGERAGLLEGFLSNLVSRTLMLRSHEIDVEMPLRDTGLDSIAVVQLRQGIRSVLGFSPAVGDFFDGSSIRAMAARLSVAAHGTSQTASALLSMDPAVWCRPSPRAKTARFRLFCLPHAGGGALSFRAWAEEAPPEIDLCPIHLPGREDRSHEQLITRLHLLVPLMARAIAPHLDRPFAILGHSLGALVAFELVRELRRIGDKSPLTLFAAGCRAPHLMWSPRPTEPGGSVQQVHRLGDVEFVEYLVRLGRMPPALVEDREALAAYLPILRADFEMLDTYVYLEGEPLATPITVFGGEQDPFTTLEGLRAWASATRASFSLRLFAGGHFPEGEQRREILREVAQAFARVDLVGFRGDAGDARGDLETGFVA